MRNKLPALIFTVLCLLLCAVLSLGTLIFGPSAAVANEVLSSAPTLKNRDGSLNTAYLSDVSEYFSDHFFLRQELITASNAITASLFGSSAEDSVILGSDGWLYYADTLDDHTGSSPMTEAQLAAVANNLSLMQEYCESQGAAFLFTLAPNKNSLYADNMPSYGAASAEHDAQRLFRCLDSVSVRYLDLFRLFGEQDEILYYAHDSHWNSKGAALAADGINDAFGRKSCYFADSFSEAIPHSGDLFEMLYPSATDNETGPVYGGSLSFQHMSDGVRPDSITIDTTGGGSGTLLAFRDSFGNDLYPYLADSFASARFSRATSYDLTQISTLSADCVLIELVERNLDYLLRYIPIMPAPERELNTEAPAVGNVSLTADRTAKTPEGCVLVKGRLDLPCDTAREVYIISQGQAYQAFLLDDCAFAAHIPADAQPESVYLFSDGTASQYTVLFD